MRPSSSSTAPERVENAGGVAGALRGWDRFWFRPADPTTLALIRLCTGLLVFYVHLTYSWDLFCYVGPEGWVDHDSAAFVQREVPVYGLSWDWSGQVSEIGKGNFYWSVFYHVTSPGWIVFWHVLFLASMLCFTLGLATRWTGLLSWVGAMCYVQRANCTVYGLDTMMMITLLYLLVGPAGEVLSLDRLIACWWARRRGEPEPEVRPSASANFAIRLLQVHLCIIYLAGGTSKLLGTTWWGGTALNLVVLNPNFAPLDWEPYYRLMKALAGYRPLWEVVMTGGIVFTLFLELGYAFLVWDRRLRWFMISCAVLLHLGIGLIMGLVTFSLMMVIMNLCFVPPEVVRVLVGQVKGWLAEALSSRKPVGSAKAGELVLTQS